jgi:hypothetical protein
MKCLAVAMGVVSLVVHTASCFTLPFMTMPILKQHKASPQKHLFLLVCPENPLVNPCQEAISEVESAVSRLEKAGAEPEEKYCFCFYYHISFFFFFARAPSIDRHVIFNK